jgi:hypothetical protein
VKNQLQAIALNRGVQKHKRLWSTEGREQLRTFPLPPWTRRRCDELLRLHEQWGPGDRGTRQGGAARSAGEPRRPRT